MLNLNEGDSNIGLKHWLRKYSQELVSCFRCLFAASETMEEKKKKKTGSMQICFQMIQFPRLFINRVNWILRKGLRGEKDFCALKYLFEITHFDSGVKDRLIDRRINKKHDKWNSNEVVSFICDHVVLLFLLWCVFVPTIDSGWNLLFSCDWTCLPRTPRPLTLNNTAITLITDQTDSVSAALGFKLPGAFNWL